MGSLYFRGRTICNDTGRFGELVLRLIAEDNTAREAEALEVAEEEVVVREKSRL